MKASWHDVKVHYASRDYAGRPGASIQVQTEDLDNGPRTLHLLRWYTAKTPAELLHARRT